MYAIVKAMIQPYLLLLIIQGLLLAVMIRKSDRRRGLLALAGTWILMLLLSMPIVSQFLLRTLETPYPPVKTLPNDVDGIVVLGGGLLAPDEYRPEPLPTQSSYNRCRQAARLYKQWPVPVIVCGGATEKEDTPTSEAEVMAATLIQLGVKSSDVILESSSQNTQQNAAAARKVIGKMKLEKVALVTGARHMRRAVACFRKQEIEVIATPSSGHSGQLLGEFDESFVPKCESMLKTSAVVKEWVGLVYYRMRGWI